MGNVAQATYEAVGCEILGAWGEEDWEDLSGLLRASGILLVARAGLDVDLARDAAQESLCRLLIAHRAGEAIHDPVAWAHRVLSRVVIDIGRRERLRAARQKDLAVLAFCSSTLPDPQALAMDRDLLVAVAGYPDRLPPPYRQAAHAKVQNWANREVFQYLQDWRRDVGPDACRYIVRTAAEMLRELASGGDPRARWPGRYEKKSAWNFTPPPPLVRLYG